jgi:hypothetical protein
MNSLKKAPSLEINFSNVEPLPSFCSTGTCGAGGPGDFSSLESRSSIRRAAVKSDSISWLRDVGQEEDGTAAVGVTGQGEKKEALCKKKERLARRGG